MIIAFQGDERYCVLQASNIFRNHPIFNCTDRDMVTRLRGLKPNICGRPFPIREYSHLYWIDLSMANDNQPDEVWKYFDSMGEPPVMIK